MEKDSIKRLIVFILLIVGFYSIGMSKDINRDDIVRKYYETLGLDFKDSGEELYLGIIDVLTYEEYSNQQFGVFYIVSTITHADVYVILVEEDKCTFLGGNPSDIIVEVMLFLQKYDVDIETIRKYMKEVVDILPILD